MAFKDNMKNARKNKGWNQKEAAENLGIKVHNIGAYEEGRAEPKFDNLQKIISGYSINPVDLHTFLYENYQVL